MVKIKKTSEKSIIPKKGSVFSAGYDIYSIDEPTVLQHSERKLFKTGIHIQLPLGYYGRIAPRSGLALKQGIDVMAGVIDSDYTGELGVILVNLDKDPSTVDTTKPIAQLIIEKHYDNDFEIVDILDETSRNENGFGSTDSNVIPIRKSQEPPVIRVQTESKPIGNPPSNLRMTETVGASIVEKYQQAGGIPIRKRYGDEMKEKGKQ